MSTIEHHWTPLNTIEHYWTPLNTIEHYWTLLNTFEHYWRLLNTFEQFWTLLNTIEHNWTLLNTIEHSLEARIVSRSGWDGFGGRGDIGQVAGQENRSLDSVGDVFVFIVDTLACFVQVTTMLFQGDDSSQSFDLLLSTSLTIWKKEVSKKAMGECRKSRRCSFKEMDVQDDAKDGLAEQLQCIAGRRALGT